MRATVRHPRAHLATAVAGVLGAAAVLFGFLQLGGALFRGDVTTVRALVPTTSALAGGSKVTMAGAQVGRVRAVRRQGTGTLVEMEIGDDRVLPVPADSRVTLRQRTPVGENYVEITPGTSRRALAEDDVLPVGQADEYVDVDQVLSVLQGRARDDARVLLQATGGALDGRGAQLRTVLGEASQVVQEGGSLFGVLSEDRAQVARLVDRLGRVSAAVGDRSEAVRVTARRGLAALRAVGRRDRQLAATLRELPSTLRQVRGTSGLLRDTASTATPVVGGLAGAVDGLRGPVADLRPAAQQARNAVRELGGAAPVLRTVVQRLERLSGPLSEALPQLHGTICQLAPMVRYTAPYTDDAIATVIGLGSASNSYDAVGHLIRLTPIMGENSMAGAPDEVTKAAHTLLRAGLLGKATPLTWHPFPEPGRIGKESAAGRPAISGPEALAKSGWRYPRVQADC
ncbi:MAG TPA: MlaD family protein [Baekduia sp.]|nr:MlaD family protein [Baekduia sp.]